MESKKAYEAFRVQPIAQPLPGTQRVESLCCWGNQLLAGLQDGSIVHFSAQQNGAILQAGKPHHFLDRKPVTQMAAVRPAARPLLVVLTEEGVRLHSLPEMLLKCQPMSSRGASYFAWSEASQLLAVALRRKVLLYRLRGSDLQEAGERLAPDAVLALAWVAPGQLVLGTRRQYMALSTATAGAPVEVASTGTAPVPLVQLCPDGQHFLLARDSSTYFHDAADGRASRRRPLQWSAPLQALATAGHYAVALTAGGGLEVRSLRRAAESHVVQRVQLPEPPRPVAPVLALAEDGSVFLAVGAPTSSGSSGGATPTATSTAASTFAASPSSAGAGTAIYRLSPVPLEEQAHTLAELGEYGEALALAALVEDEAEADGKANAHGDAANAHAAAARAAAADTAAPSKAESSGSAAPIGAHQNGEATGAAARAVSAADGDVRDGGDGGGSGIEGGGGGGGAAGTSRRALLEERLRLAYGHYLFQSGEYDEGMAQLALCRSTTALVLLRLFPSLVPAKFKHLLPSRAASQPLPEVQEPAGAAYVTAVSELLPYILSHRTRAIAALAEAEADAVQHAAVAEAGDADAGGPPADAQSQERSSSHAHASSSAPSQAAASAVSGSAAAPAEAAGSVPGPGALPPAALLRVLDTAIVRLLVVLPDTGSLLRFVQLPNHVDLREGEQALSESGMYAELAALYKYNGRHEEGLELLRRLSQEPDALQPPARGAAADLPGLPGVWAAARYLVSLSAEHVPTIQRHAGWILAADPEAGLSALLHMRPPLHPSLALSILNQHSRHYCSAYLETALQTGVALPQDYHNELLLIYLRDILAKEPRPQPRGGSATGSHSGEELKELLLPQRPAEPDAPQLLFPEELAQALLHHGAGGAGPGGTGTGTGARRFASAPASSAGTPGGVSRVPSQVSVQSGAGAGAGQGQQVARAASAGVSRAQRSARDSAASGSEAEDGESSGDESDTGAASSSPAAAAAGKPPAPRRRPRRPLRPNASAADEAEPSKPPLPPTVPTTALASVLAAPADADAVAAAAKAAAAGPPLIQRLRDLVYTSPYIDPSYVLDKLPPGELLEIRALMLERLGCHREALRLYVHALRDLAAAEAYCDRVYAAATGGGGGGGGDPGAAGAPPPPRRTPSPGLPSELERPGDIYLELVQALYDGPESCPSAAAVAAAGGHGSLLASVAGADGDALASVWRAGRDSVGGARLDSATWQALSRLLSRKRERLDSMQVLALLPDGVAVADVLPWLESSLRYALEERRNLAVIHQLRRGENLAALEEAVRMRQQRVVVTAERACSLCHKRIGGAVFVAYPGGLLAHYLCHKRHTDSGGGGAAGAEGGGAEGGAGWAGGGAAVVEVQQGMVRGRRESSGGSGEGAAWAY